MAENIFAHIESIEWRRVLHQNQLDKAKSQLANANTPRQKAKIQHQIDYSSHQIAMIQKEWDFEDQYLRKTYPETFNISDEDLLLQLGI